MVRADALLVAKGLAPSRTAAHRLVEAGRVSWLGKPVAKPAQELPPDAELRVAESEEDRYVSRGGLTLAGALAHTGFDVRGCVCLDVGQSTGGFTDCLLQAGAARVVGVDGGRDQLHPRLRGDACVTCLEGINARNLAKAPLPERRFDLIVADVSFISLTLVLPELPPLLHNAGDMLLLVKPQFEVGAAHIGKGGIVRNPALYGQVEAKLRAAAAECRLAVQDWFDSPIAGGDGNREFFLWLKHDEA
ncbi:MAG TPA: TlyA family RNA methyltransferase [Rhodocyclaceae bacterium]|nr:TlyA family RNA methyltransferase [Rhodocyclaceae bacterium]